MGKQICLYQILILGRWVVRGNDPKFDRRVLDWVNVDLGACWPQNVTKTLQIFNCPPDRLHLFNSLT